MAVTLTASMSAATPIDMIVSAGFATEKLTIFLDSRIGRNITVARFTGTLYLSSSRHSFLLPQII